MLLPDTLFPRDREAALGGRWADISPHGLNQLIDFATNAQSELQALLINANGEVMSRPGRIARQQADAAIERVAAIASGDAWQPAELHNE